jgi:hypothetical protein
MSSSCSYYSDNVLASDTEGKSFKPGLLEFKMHPIRNLRHALVDVKVDWGSSRRCESGLVNESTTSLRNEWKYIGPRIGDLQACKIRL